MNMYVFSLYRHRHRYDRHAYHQIRIVVDPLFFSELGKKKIISYKNYNQNFFSKNTFFDRSTAYSAVDKDNNST